MSGGTQLAVGQVWRRKTTGALVRITRLVNTAHQSREPYYDVLWESLSKPTRRGCCWQDYWLRDNEFVEASR